MMNSDQLYELAQIREQEYMLSAVVRRARRQRRRQSLDLVAGVARRVYRRGRSED